MLGPEKVKYLGFFVTSKLNWSDNCKYCVHIDKATVCLNVLCLVLHFQLRTLRISAL